MQDKENLQIKPFIKLMVAFNQILQLKATKGRIIFGRKNYNSGHSDRDERKKYERIAAASIDQTVFTHGRKKK